MSVDGLITGAGAQPTPTQARVMTDLFGSPLERPTFGAELGSQLRRDLEARLDAVADALPDRTVLSINKAGLDQIHTCEGWWQAEQTATFSWNAARAYGTVAHKAVELAVTLTDVPPPLDLVDMAIRHLIDFGGDWGPRDWLLDAPQTELAELRAAASDWVIKFEDTFPRPRRAWRPRVESPLALELCDGRIVLRGKVDLALGRAEGTRANVLIIDFKTGRMRQSHLDGLRFYALIETVRVGVPPFRLAAFGLDSGTWLAEDVDEGVLDATVRRVVDGVTKIAAVAQRDGPNGADRPPRLTPGPACRWCPAAPSCASARIDEE